MTDSAIRIREGRPEDSTRCQEIAVAAWQRIHAVRRDLLGSAIHSRVSGDWEALKAADVDRVFQTHPEWTRVAVAGGQGAGDEANDAEQVVGFVTFALQPAKLVGVIGNNAVDPAWARQGIATALYLQALDAFRAAGMRVAQVTTGLDAGHAPALAAYRKIGFTAEAPSVTLYQEL
jgi:ribosomal protein S18 acetylase RimI-like enzyme